MGLWITLTKPIYYIAVLAWDTPLTLLNLVLPNHRPGTVVPAHALGHNRIWPPYHPPTEGDSRSACPLLNALANHGVLPRDGRNISFPAMKKAVQDSTNFAPSFSFFVPWFAACFLNRSYWSGTFDLAELSLHNAIEHDGSLTRLDAALQPDQSKPDALLVEQLCASATGRFLDGEHKLLAKDLSIAEARRRVESKKINKAYTEDLFHDIFGSSKYVCSEHGVGGKFADILSAVLQPYSLYLVAILTTSGRCWQRNGYQRAGRVR